MTLARGRLSVHRSIGALAATLVGLVALGVVGLHVAPAARPTLIAATIAEIWLVLVSTTHHELAHAWLI